MGFGNLGAWEIILIVFVILLLFGARRLPEIGQSLGKGIKEFKKSLSSADDEAKLTSGDQGSSQVESPPKREETH